MNAQGYLKSALLVGWVCLAVTACSKVGFTASPPGTNTTALTTPPGSTSGSVPKVQFISPACAPKTNCLVEFQLDKAYPQTTEFDWHTDDTLYQTTHTPAYGQPAVDYVSTSGHVTFQAGETLKSTYVQNISDHTYEILIGTLINNCVYGTQTVACANFFQ